MKYYYLLFIVLFFAQSCNKEDTPGTRTVKYADLSEAFTVTKNSQVIFEEQGLVVDFNDFSDYKLGFVNFYSIANVTWKLHQKEGEVKIRHSTLYDRGGSLSLQYLDSLSTANSSPPNVFWEKAVFNSKYKLYFLKAHFDYENPEPYRGTGLSYKVDSAQFLLQIKE